MRVYAIHARKRWILIVATIPVLARMGIDFWTLTEASNASVSDDALERSISNNSCEYIGQPAVISRRQPLFGLEISSIAIALFFDTFVLVLTLNRAYCHVVEMHRLKRASITQVIVRDGVLLIFGVRVINLIVQMPQLQTSDYMIALGGVVDVYYNYAPNMLVNRLVLNLRMYDSEELFPNPHLSTMVFADTSTEGRVLGNIGAPLDHDQWSHGQGEPVDDPSEF
ncbi:uncharacterized protein STEHIDRAFT_163755 [Stereum hirsutum FP-91666 SS1]|uniref:Uncharacterized protein n=1 Tax=Stereum hirsutum (strain FP-91666) TaxID=721885 RepID=R7RVW8_STEHR|nr:uncharacterized protein STEHIDRAFT_163755 [Stereum hirsutum FP-91666 SS1]EIM79396.1 hypothetical protein STEHIDRAFT_163755 [Stereum hirsutum FP-91666 SS1]